MIFLLALQNNAGITAPQTLHRLQQVWMREHVNDRAAEAALQVCGGALCGVLDLCTPVCALQVLVIARCYKLRC